MGNNNKGGWNRSSGNEPVKKGEAKASPVKGITAGLVVVVLGAAVAWLFWSGGETRQDAASTKERGRIKEVKPAVAPTNPAPKKAEKKVEIKKLPDGKIMKYVDGKEAWMFPRQDYHGPIHTTRVHHVETIEEKCFKNKADRQIASLLMIRPGSSIVGNPRYEDTFVRDFLASFDNPAIPMPGDTDEEKELKRAVAEVKGDLKAKYDAGEDIAQIMIDTRKKLRELNTYKRELEAQLHNQVKDGTLSAADIEDYVTAANQMLSDRGIEPIKINGFIKHQIKLRNKAKEVEK